MSTQCQMRTRYGMQEFSNSSLSSSVFLVCGFVVPRRVSRRTMFASALRHRVRAEHGTCWVRLSFSRSELGIVLAICRDVVPGRVVSRCHYRARHRFGLDCAVETLRSSTRKHRSTLRSQALLAVCVWAGTRRAGCAERTTISKIVRTWARRGVCSVTDAHVVLSL